MYEAVRGGQSRGAAGGRGPGPIYHTGNNRNWQNTCFARALQNRPRAQSRAWTGGGGGGKRFALSPVLEERRGSRYIIRGEGAAGKRAKKERVSGEGGDGSGGGRRVTGLSLHLLKQYNNSFLSHPLSKGFYCDGQPPSRNCFTARQTIVEPARSSLSLFLSPLLSRDGRISYRDLLPLPWIRVKIEVGTRNTNLFFPREFLRLIAGRIGIGIRDFFFFLSFSFFPLAR